MKNKKGFTLVETLAVIILLGVILMIAVPSINNVVARNRKSRFREATEMFVVLAKQRLETDTSINYPEDGKVIVMSLDMIDIKQLENIIGESAKEGTQIKWKSTGDKSSKVVFKYNGSKWENIFVVLYDGSSNAFYYNSDKIVSGKDLENPNLNDSYICDFGPLGGYCYVEE